MNNSGKKHPIKTQNNLITTPFKKAYDRFLRIRGNPTEIAWGLAAGIMVGMTPLIGLHTIIVLFITALFKWNKISAVFGVYITNPLTAPFIYTMTYWVGAKIIGNGNTFSLHRGEGLMVFLNILLQTPDIFWKMVLGGFILGLPVAIISFYFSYKVLYKYQADIKRKLLESKRKMAIKKEIRKRRRIKKKRQSSERMINF
jgi:uncharacterized protein (DUF2062 family)